MNRDQRAPGRIVLSYPQQRSLDKWLDGQRQRIADECWGMERISVEATSDLGFRVTAGNLRTVLEAMDPPLVLTNPAGRPANFVAPLQRRVDALEDEVTQQSLRVQSLAARVEEALTLLANLEGVAKRLGSGVAEVREQVSVARTEIAKALTELGFRKIDASVSRAAFQALSKPEPNGADAKS